MARIWVMWAGWSGALGVALGAFGGHILRPILPLQVMTIFETAVRYHLIHTLALFGTALLMVLSPPLAERLQRVAQLFLAGLALFSGSLYMLAFTGFEWLGFATPIGGLCWIAAWIGLAWVYRSARSRRYKEPPVRPLGSGASGMSSL